MQAFFSEIVNNWINWVIAGFVVWRVIEGVRDSQLGKVVWGVVLGGLAYFFANNPMQVLQKASELVSKLWGS